MNAATEGGKKVDRQGRILYNKGIKTVKGKTEMKKISGILKLTLAVCLTVGTTLATIACGINNVPVSSSGPSTSYFIESQTTTSGETTSAAETTTVPPVIDEKQETINKFLSLLDEMAERNGVDEIRDIMLKNKKPELSKEDYYQLCFGADSILYDSDVLEYYILPEEDYKTILSSMNYIFRPNRVYHFDKEELIDRYKHSSLDIINEAIETKERYNEDNPYKYEIDYEKKKEKDLAEFNDFLAKVSTEHGGKEVSSIAFKEDRNGFKDMILFYKVQENVELNLRSYALKDEWYETISEKLFGEEQYKSITIDELIKNYDSDVFDCILESIHTYRPVINPKTL